MRRRIGNRTEFRGHHKLTAPAFKVGVEELMALFVARKVLAPMTGTVAAAALTEGFNRPAEQASGQVTSAPKPIIKAFFIIAFLSKL